MKFAILVIHAIVPIVNQVIKEVGVINLTQKEDIFSVSISVLTFNDQLNSFITININVLEGCNNTECYYDGIEVYDATVVRNYSTYLGESFYGYYSLMPELFNGRNHFRKGKIFLTWNGIDEWHLSLNETNEVTKYASIKKDISCVHEVI